MNLLTITDKWIKDREHMSDDTIGMELRRLCKEKMESSAPTLHQKFLEIYDEFHQKKLNCGAKIGAKEGAAAKSILQYISKESKVKTDDGILASWEYILNNWQRLEPFYRNRMQITDINSNLTNILNQLRNGNGKHPNTENIEQQIAEKISANHI